LLLLLQADQLIEYERELIRNAFGWSPFANIPLCTFFLFLLGAMAYRLGMIPIKCINDS
jgi:hypothetical protein